jgi:hypothetical protein
MHIPIDLLSLKASSIIPLQEFPPLEEHIKTYTLLFYEREREKGIRNKGEQEEEILRERVPYAHRLT